MPVNKHDKKWLEAKDQRCAWCKHPWDAESPRDYPEGGAGAQSSCGPELAAPARPLAQDLGELAQQMQTLVVALTQIVQQLQALLDQQRQTAAWVLPEDPNDEDPEEA